MEYYNIKLVRIDFNDSIGTTADIKKNGQHRHGLEEQERAPHLTLVVHQQTRAETW